MATFMGFDPVDTTPYFFISYNTEDKERITPALLNMYEHGLPIWYDYGIPYDAKWTGVIAEKIDHCQAVLLFFSKGILTKDDSFVIKEYKLARRYKKHVYIIMLDKLDFQDIPYDKVDFFMQLADLQTINMFDLSQETLVHEVFRATNWKYSEISTSLGKISGEDCPKPYEGTSPYIFVSYTDKEKTYALKVISELQSRGYNVWFDRGITVGAEWDNEPANKLEKCIFFISLVTESYGTSWNCMQELEYAMNLKKNMIILYLNECSITDKKPWLKLQLGLIRSLHRAEFSSDKELLDELCSMEDMLKF